jgi:hypothetical protein
MTPHKMNLKDFPKLVVWSKGKREEFRTTGRAFETLPIFRRNQANVARMRGTNNLSCKKAALWRGFSHQNARKIRDPHLTKNPGQNTAKSKTP